MNIGRIWLVYVLLGLLWATSSNGIHWKLSKRSVPVVKVSSEAGNNKHLVGILPARGGKVSSSARYNKNQKNKHGPIALLKAEIGKVRPVTRTYLLLSTMCLITHLSGLPAPGIFALNPAKWWQIWRPFTSVAYFGGLSMSMANNIYFLINYGQLLEKELGAGSHAWFLLVQTALISFLGLCLGSKLNAQSLIAATVYMCSYMHPLEELPFQFGLTITSWQLPYCLMILDVLSHQTMNAAWPHVLGILSGHIYRFSTVIWPSLGGKSLLKPPKWILKLGGPPRSNVPLGRTLNRD